MNSLESNVHLDEYLDFQKYWLVIKRRWLPAMIAGTSVVGLSLIYALSLPPMYEGEAKLLIKTDRSASLTGIGKGSGKVDVISEDSDPLATEAEIVSSRPVINKLIQELNLQDDEGELLKYDVILDSLKVKTVTGTDVLQITYQDTDPELAASVVNKAIQIYKSQDTLSNRTEAATARTFITEQLPQVEANVKKAEAKLREFKNKHRIANLGEETTSTVNSLSGLENQIGATKANLEDIDARYNRLRSQLRVDWKEASAISTLSQSVAVQNVFERLQQVKLQLTQRRNYLSEKNPQIISLKEDIVGLQKALNREIDITLGSEQRKLLKNVNILAVGELNQGQIADFANLGLQREGLQKRLAALNDIYSSNKRNSTVLPQLEEQHKELERRVEASQSTYKVLLNKLQETRVAEEQDIGKVRVVSKAIVPDDPVGPSKTKIVLGGGILGGFFALALAFLLDIRDNTIKNAQEAEKILAYPLHGVVPDYNFLGERGDSKNTSTLVPAGHEMSILPLREAYQNIQVSLRLFESKKDIETIAVTSSVSGEGKTSVSANYATSIAQSGHNVLLIDGDMRRPSQHKRWQIPNQVGLSDVLQEKLPWQNAVQNALPKLDILTAGTIPENPVVLLDSLSMNILLMKLLEHYDRIVFDTPPLVGLADSKLIGKLVDGLLFVVRPGVTNYASVTAAQKILENKDLNVLGVVTNGVNLDKEPLGYGYYSVDKKYLQVVK